MYLFVKVFSSAIILISLKPLMYCPKGYILGLDSLHFENVKLFNQMYGFTPSTCATQIQTQIYFTSSSSKSLHKTVSSTGMEQWK